MLHALCLFAGIAGIELGLSLVANVTPVCFVEKDKFCQDILRRRYPNAWIWDDVTTFPAEDWAGVDLLTAGFPCQPWSYAGSRAGTADDRWLWARIVEVIRLSGPRIVLLENVPGLLAGGLGHVLADLAALGFHAEWGVFSCADLEAPQRRERVFIVAVRRDFLADAPREQNRGAFERGLSPNPGPVGAILAHSDRSDLRQQSISIPRGGSASEPGRTSEAMEHSQSLQCGQGRESEGAGPGRPRSPGKGLADWWHDLPATRGKHPTVGVGQADSNGQRLEERTLPEGIDEIPPAFGSLPELGDSDSEHGRQIWERITQNRRAGSELADSPSERGRELPRRGAGRDNLGGPDISVWPPSPGGDWRSVPPKFWPTECGLRQLAHGLPTRLERSLRRSRLKALGNSVSPPVVAAAWLELGRRLGLW